MSSVPSPQYRSAKSGAKEMGDIASDIRTLGMLPRVLKHKQVIGRVSCGPALHQLSQERTCRKCLHHAMDIYQCPPDAHSSRVGNSYGNSEYFEAWQRIRPKRKMGRGAISRVPGVHDARHVLTKIPFAPNMLHCFDHVRSVRQQFVHAIISTTQVRAGMRK